jgi:hypothetical protein
MRFKNLTRAVALSGVLSFASAGMAFAADDASINDTGPSSNNVVSFSNNSTVSVINNNNLSVNNSNDQNGTSGSANVSGNTSEGNAMTGDVTNTNSATTTINVGNDSGGLGAGSGGGSGSGAGAGSGGSGSGSSAIQGAGSGQGSGEALQTLPTVGCEQVCDVSALRAAYHPSNPATQALQQAKGLSAIPLGLAIALSLIGAGGSAAFASRRAKA